ncbi:hypothetical protein G6O69_31070 [Pseudenhygromyxa sp. WMMC2535]|uniref:hypothetical protein n=1 Tax=Pseudenhygromyxa sp. WMMC2535 TaxID=2712867 RepID=UPI0015527048|nr:hypothetical protein [Pseudenhygromyxa sp. WMMC2535]NVB42306.1 hypothetical protein [Pseudenhygromyxa sp. WMMC2535]
MAELPEQLRRDLAKLASARAHASPPPGAEARVYAALEAASPWPQVELDAPPDAQNAGPQPDIGAAELLEVGARGVAGAAKLAWGAKVVAITLALTGGGLLGLRGVVLATRAISPPPATSLDPRSQTGSPAPASPPAHQAAPPQAQPAPEDASVQPPPPSSEPPAALPPKAAAKPAAAPLARYASRASSPEDLAAELALLEAARAASSPAAALEQLQRHEQRYPEGVLAMERDLLTIENLCALERFDAARTRERRFARDHADSPQLTKLRTRCPQLASPRQPTQG